MEKDTIKADFEVVVATTQVFVAQPCKNERTLEKEGQRMHLRVQSWKL